MLLSDAFFHTSLLPWHSLYLWYARTELHPYLAPPGMNGDGHQGALVMPATATLRAVAVELEDLWKIRAPVGNCEGFDLGYFDRMIEVHVRKFRSHFTFLGLKIFHFISLEKGLGRAKMLCHSPLPHNGYTCVKDDHLHAVTLSPKRYHVATNH